MPGVLDSAILVVALLRARAGWRRGFVSQVLDLAGFAAAALLAYRFHCVLAIAWRGVGMSEGWAKVAGALTAFVPVIAAVAFVGWKLGKITRQPGLNLTNRLLGAGLAVLVAAVGLSLLQVLLALAPIGGADRVLRSAPTASALLDLAEPAARGLQRLAGLVLPGGGCRR